jgi:hypothetical protein
MSKSTAKAVHWFKDTMIFVLENTKYKSDNFIIVCLTAPAQLDLIFFYVPPLSSKSLSRPILGLLSARVPLRAHTKICSHSQD